MKTKSIMFGIAILTLCLSFGLTAYGGSVYVSTNAIPAAPHDTWANAFTNVQDALDAASDGDTIYLAGQTFALDAQIDWTTPGLTVRGGYEADPAGASPGKHGPEQWPTVLARSGAANQRIIHINGANNSTLKNVTIAGGHLTSDSGSGLRIDGSQNVVLSGCIVENNTHSQGVSATVHPAAIRAASSSVTLTNCIVRHNTGENSRGSDNRAHAIGAAIYSDGNLTLRDCRIFNNSFWVQRTHNWVNGGGIYFHGSTLDMHNVLVVGNSLQHGAARATDRNLFPVTTSMAGGGIHVISGTATIRNCTVADNGGDGIRRDGGAINITDSIVWGNWTNIVGSSVTADNSNIGDDGYASYGAGNINADPLFEYGYYLADGSPCLGAGSDTAGNLGLEGYVKNAAGDAYAAADTVNLGYNYVSGFDVVHTDLYVAADGDDVNDGSEGSPFRTVTHALSLTHADTRIHVATGLYSSATTGEAFPIEVPSLTGIRIIGSSAADTIFDAGNAGVGVFDLLHADRVTIENLTLTGGNIKHGSGLRAVSSQNVVLSGCIVEEHHYEESNSSGFYPGAILAEVSSMTLSNSIVRNNSFTNTRSNDSDAHVSGGGIYSDSPLTILDSRITDNRFRVSTPNASNRNRSPATVRGAGVYYQGGPRLKMRNTLVAGNTVETMLEGGHGQYLRGGGMYVFCGGNGSVRLQNCTIADNAAEGIRQAGEGTVYAIDSIIWGNWTNIVGASVTADHSNIGDDDYASYGTGNINADPLFEYGYYLADGSPCVDTGSDTAENLGLTAFTTRTDGVGDSGTVNLGFHYPTGFAMVYPDIYVSLDGNDGNPGTGAAPGEAFRTIGKALATAHDGTRIHVAPGHYIRAVGETAGETFPLTLESVTGVRILGTDAAATVFDATDAGQRVLMMRGANRTELEGISITGGNEIDGAGLRIENSQNVRIIDCVLSNNAFRLYQSGTLKGGGAFFKSSGVFMSGCLVIGNTAENTRSSFFSRGGGIWSEGVLTIHNSRLLDNSATALNASYGRGGGLAFDGGCIRLSLRNVLLAGNHASGSGGALYVEAGTATMENGTVADHTGQGIHRFDGDVSLLNSIVWDNDESLVGDFESVTYSNIEGAEVYAGEGNINADPLFENAGAGDYRLQPGSPAIDAGLNQPWMVGATDLDGLPRIMMGTVDMGCYEAVPPAGTLIYFR